MSNKHKHYDCIIAFAEGKKIEYYEELLNEWREIGYPNWYENVRYRIKSEPKPDIRARLWGGVGFHLVFVFDGETKAFKTVEYHDD